MILGVTTDKVSEKHDIRKMVEVNKIVYNRKKIMLGNMKTTNIEQQSCDE